METIIDQLNPETITYLEEVYGSLSGWLDVAANWATEQWNALNSVITEDIHF